MKLPATCDACGAAHFGFCKAAEVRMMREPERWPLWPRLPLKRFTRQGEPPGFAILLSGAPLKFYENALPPDNLDGRTPRLVHDPTLLYDEGWRVD